jgi:hypothetical protein
MLKSSPNIELNWNIVCGSAEIEELARYNRIREWSPRNERHALFLTIKHPDTKFYKGAWGTELLHFVDDGPYRGKVGKIYCSYERYTIIAKWFLVNMFPP